MSATLRSWLLGFRRCKSLEKMQRKRCGPPHEPTYHHDDDNEQARSDSTAFSILLPHWNERPGASSCETGPANPLFSGCTGRIGVRSRTKLFYRGRLISCTASPASVVAGAKFDQGLERDISQRAHLVAALNIHAQLYHHFDIACRQSNIQVAMRRGQRKEACDKAGTARPQVFPILY